MLDYSLASSTIISVILNSKASHNLILSEKFIIVMGWGHQQRSSETIKAWSMHLPPTTVTMQLICSVVGLVQLEDCRFIALGNLRFSRAKTTSYEGSSSIKTMEMKLDTTGRRSNVMLVAFCFLLFTHNLVLVPVLSAAAFGGFDDLKCASPPPSADPYGGPPPSGSHGSPPRHGGGGGSTPYRRSPPPSFGGGGGSPPSSGGGTPTDPGITPSPTTPGGGGGGVYTPSPPTVGSPPLVLSPPPTPFIDPGIGGSPPTTPYINPGTGGTPPFLPYTPGIPGILPGSPIFLPDPNSNPFSGTCDFWRNNPGLIWGLLGWWGTLGSIFGHSSLPSINPTMTLPQALSIPPAADGFTSLYREASASYLNSMAYRHFPYSPKQVRDRLAAALHSNRAASHQARVFKLANEGRLKPRA